MPTGMTFTDISAILASINKAATGQELDSPIINTADFVSVATATLLTGYDNLCNAISQVMTRTMFAVRPYTPQFRALQMDGSAYGNHERKINYIDTEPVKDVSYSLPVDGTSTGVDPFEVHRPKVLQTNFYGQVNYSRVYSQGRVQLNAAFTGPDQLAEFWAAFAMHYSNMRAQDDENMCRNLIANYMGGLTKTTPTAVYYLLDEYNAQTGKSLTSTSVYAPENFPDFARFAYARIKDVSDLLQARSINNHQNWQIGGATYNIMRHTPKSMQHLYLFSQTQHQINARVLSDTFHDNRLEYGAFEMVPFWQNIDDRDAVQVTPIYTATDGTQKTDGGNVGLANIFAFIHDRDAIGYTPIAANMDSIYNPRGQYTNFWGHYGYRWYNDFTENSALFLLTSADVTAPAAMSAAATTMKKSLKITDPEPNAAAK